MLYFKKQRLINKFLEFREKQKAKYEKNVMLSYILFSFYA